MIISTIFMIMSFKLLITLPNGLSCPPHFATARPVKIAATMIGSIFFLLIRPEKSSTVSVLTIISPTLAISPISPLVISIVVFAAGGNTFTTTSTRTDAISPVTINTPIREPRIFPRRFIFNILPTALTIETKTIGTTTINSRLMNTLPIGASIVAFSPKIAPRIAPKIIPPKRISGKR